MHSEDIKYFKEQLEEKLKSCSNVFILGHNSPDFDSIASCMALYTISSKYKDSYIIVDDELSKLESGVKRILDENRDKYPFIKLSDFYDKVEDNSLILIADTNKKNMISIPNIENYKNIMIIDHHLEDENTISTDNILNSTDVSSASEVITRLLGFFKIKYSKDLANYLLAGISLDTKRFKRNTSAKTHDVAEKLIEKGADINYDNNLFLEEFESFCRISNLIINGTIIKKYSEDTLAPIQVSFTLNRNNKKSIYLKEDYAKAADKMLKFNGIDAAFALGYVDDKTIHISARSTKKVNVGKIMKEVYGGGNSQSAGGRVESDDIDAIEEKLMNSINIGISDDIEVMENPSIIKVKQIKKEKIR